MSVPKSNLLKFPSIGRPPVVFRHVERAAQYVGLKRHKPVYDTSLALPCITFKGTVKVDGANCAIVKTRKGAQAAGTYQQHYQSRQKVLAADDDFMGFVEHMAAHGAVVDKLFKDIVDNVIEVKDMKQDDVDSIETIAIFGEWCGDKIQKNIALYQLPKMFIIFAVKIHYEQSHTRPKQDDQVEWVAMDHLEDVSNNKARIFNIGQFEWFQVKIDFGDEKSKAAAQAEMEEMTRRVRKQCPVAKALGVTDKLVNGEGIVWKPVAVEAPLKLDKFSGPKCWIKTGSKSVPTTNDEMMRLTKTGW